MIRIMLKTNTKDDPEKWEPVFPRDKRVTFAWRSYT